MRVMMHYIEETKAGGWEWTHVQIGGYLPSKGPTPDKNGQITLYKASPEGNQYTVLPKFDRKTTAPRPQWALGLIVMGFLGFYGAAQMASYPIGAAMFAIVGLVAIAAGVLSYQKSFHIYALFSVGTAMQIPYVRSWIDHAGIDEALQFTSDSMAQDAASQLGREILNPQMPWGLIIAAAIAGLGGGAIIGIIAAHFPGK